MFLHVRRWQQLIYYKNVSQMQGLHPEISCTPKNIGVSLPTHYNKNIIKYQLQNMEKGLCLNQLVHFPADVENRIRR